MPKLTKYANKTIECGIGDYEEIVESKDGAYVLLEEVIALNQDIAIIVNQTKQAACSGDLTLVKQLLEQLDTHVSCLVDTH